MSVYTVRGVKTFKGRDGTGYNCTLLRDGNPVAVVLEGANGGEVRFHWSVMYGKAPYLMSDGRTVQIGAEEALLRDHIKGKTVTYDGTELELTLGMFVEQLVNEHEADLLMKRRCRASTCYRLKTQDPGQFMVAAVIFTKEIGEKLRAQCGERLEIIYNEKYAK